MTEDPGALGEKIADIEIRLIQLANHPDPTIRAKARAGLKRVEAMKQEIWNAIQDLADAQAGNNDD